MADIKLFGLTLDKSGVVRAMKDVTDAGVQMAREGAKNAQLYSDAYREKLNVVARQWIPETMKAWDALGERETAVAKASKAAAGDLTSLGDAVRIQADDLRKAEQAYKAYTASMQLTDEVQQKVAASATGSSVGLGRIRQGLTSLVAQMTGTLPVLDRIVSSMGGMAAGNEVVVGVLAGLAAVAYGYRVLTRDAREAAEAQDAALKKLEEWDKKRHMGPGGEFSETVGGAQSAVARQTERRGVLGAISAVPGGGGIASFLGLFMTGTKKDFQGAIDAVRDGSGALGEESNRAFLDQRAREAATLAENIRSNNLAHGERQRAIQMLKEDRALMAQYQRAGVSGDLRSALGTQIETLDGALNPTEKPTRDRDADARQKEADRFYNAQNKQKISTLDMIEVARREREETERRVAAVKAGTDAEREFTDALELERAHREFLTASDKLDEPTREKRWAAIQAEIVANQQLNHTLTDLEQARRDQEAADKKQAEAERKAAEAAVREQQRQLQAIDSLLKSSAATFFTDVLSKGKNEWQSLWDAIKQGFIRMLADMLAASASARIASVVGTTFAGMLIPGAASAQSSAAGTNLGLGESGALSQALAAPRSTAGFGSYAAIGAGSFTAGYGVGGSLFSTSHGDAGNYARGGIGGAAAGAGMGAMLGSVVPGIGTAVGAIVGGAVGFIGGVLGMGSASKEAARQMAEAQKQVALSMAALKAEVTRDTVGAGVAQVEADREARRKAIEDAYQGGGADSDTVRQRNAALAEMNALEDQRIALLKKEYAQQQVYDSQDLQVRLLRAQGKLDEADALAFSEQQQKEYNDAVNAGKDAQYLATLQAVQYAEAIAHTSDVMQAAVRNAPTGFKVSGYQYDYASAAGASPSRTSANTAPVTIDLRGASFNVKGNSGPELLTNFVAALKQKAGETVGSNVPLSAALDRIA